MRRRTALFVGVLLVAALAPAVAAAAPRARLVYAREAGADACPDENALRQGVMSRLGYDPFSPDARRTVTATVRSTTRGLLAHIELSDASGEPAGRREMASPRRDCSDLAPAMELAIALAIDPLGRPSAPLAAPNPPPAGSTAPGDAQPDAISAEFGGDSVVRPPFDSESPGQPRATRPATPRAPQRAPGEPTRIRAGLGVVLGLDASPPIASGGLVLQLGFRQRAWSMTFLVRGDHSFVARDYQQTDANGRPAGPSAPLSTQAVAGGLVPCAHWPLLDGHIELAACVMIIGGAQWASGLLFPNGRTDSGPSAQLGGGLALEVPLGQRLALRVNGDALAALASPQLTVGDGVVYKPPQGAGALGATLLVYLR